jgi:shikimate dehydrogenase
VLKLAVIGDPVDHSASPTLHRGFLDAAGIAGTYETIRVRSGEGAHAIEELRAAGYTGLNVTTPLKEEAFARADERDPIARVTGAVNTLVLGPTIRGYNTDGIGALGALASAGLVRIADRHVLVLGAGPTARAAVAALVDAGATVTIWNRTQTKADAIVRDLAARAWTFEHGDADAYDAVFSTLSPGVAIVDATLVRALHLTPIIVDANYAVRATLGKAIGRDDVADGAAMLAASARAAFDYFRAAS